MAPPLSTDSLPLSHELRDVFHAAHDMASNEGSHLQSSHLLFALYTVDARVSAFLTQNRVPRLSESLKQSARSLAEPQSTLERILDRSKRLAHSSSTQDAADITIDSMHLLAAMLRESRSTAYQLLEAGGLKVSGIRMKARNHLFTPPPQEQQQQAQVQQSHVTASRSPHTAGTIGFHPGLAARTHTPQHTTHALRSPRMQTTQQEITSPVHPALHDYWLRTTPAQGMPAVDIAQLSPPAAPQAAASYHGAQHTHVQELPPVQNTGEHQVGLQTSSMTAGSLETTSGVHKSLKEKFAELKQQARKRRQRVQPPTLPPEKMPPSVRRASQTIHRTPASNLSHPQAFSPVPFEEEHEPICDEPLSEASEVTPQDTTQKNGHISEAMEDAKDTTRSLAARLFGRTESVEEHIVEERIVDTPTLAAPLEIKPKTKSISSTSITQKITQRPDAKLAALYRLDPKDYPILSKFGRNLTEEAALQRLDAAIGREDEITALIDILGKRRSNNPMLLGDPGVGKTAIVEGLAHEFVNLAKRGSRAGERAIVELELGRILSGTHLRGALSERLIAIKDEVWKANGKVIVFLDEIHSWLNAGNGGDGSDAAGELKTALARGHFPCIGATTNDEYTQFIEADPAFQRRFQPVHVDEPSVETAIAIAQGIRETYERHHGVTYADAAIESAVRLSQRYIHDRQLPDKAINVLDLAGSRASREARAYVRRTDIAHIVAEMASLPAERLTLSDRSRFLEIEQQLSRSIIGHEHVVRAVAEVLRRNYAGFRSSRPIGSLLFLGPTGVGKTEMVKALADFLFHDRDAIVRLDMSEFMEAHAVSRLIGAPPGYVGHEQGGQLTEAVRKRPYQVILMDELEKAHPDVLNVLLQVMDEGRLTDGKGRLVDFSNTLIIMTSNLGSHVFDSFVAEFSRNRIGFGGLIEQPTSANKQAELTEQVEQVAQKHFTPELWNRIDERLVFLPLREDEVAQIAVLQLEDSAQRLEQEAGISLDFTDEVIAHLIRHGGYDRKLGARPMRHTIQRCIEGTIAKMILSNQISRGDCVDIDVSTGDELTFVKQQLI